MALSLIESMTSGSRGRNRGYPRGIRALGWSASLVGLMFAIEAADVILSAAVQAPGSVLERYGIVPRTERGLLGILVAPLLHHGFPHLLANAGPLGVLLWWLLWDRQYKPGRALACIWLGSGLGTWLLGRGQAVHLGASGLVYGLAVYLVLAGLYSRSWRAVAVALGVLALYGGLIYGLLPQAGPVSWEGHLSGALAGAWAARRIRIR